MSAEVETMMYARETPWHGEGIYVGEENILSAEAIVAAGLDWTVSKRALFFATEEGVLEVPTHMGVVRDTDDALLGVVGSKYSPLQNHEAFELMDSLVGVGEMKYHTAGSLRGGKRVWLLGQIGSHEVVPGDRVDQFMLLWSTHDGSGAVRILPTEVRVVCANTAAIALSRGRKKGVTVRHTKNMRQRLQSAQSVLGLVRESFEESAEFQRSLAKVDFRSHWNDFANALIPDREGVRNTRASNRRAELSHLFWHGQGQELDGVYGTGWAAYNAVTEFNSFERTVRGSNASRFEASLFGAGAAFKQSAVTHLSAYI